MKVNSLPKLFRPVPSLEQYDVEKAARLLSEEVPWLPSESLRIGLRASSSPAAEPGMLPLGVALDLVRLTKYLEPDKLEMMVLQNTLPNTML